jgi:hypothetical protein
VPAGLTAERKSLNTADLPSSSVDEVLASLQKSTVQFSLGKVIRRFAVAWGVFSSQPAAERLLDAPGVVCAWRGDNVST